MTAAGPEPTIERMTTKHLPQVARIERDVFQDPWSKAAFADVLTFTSTCWVALREKQVVGYLVTHWVLDEIHIYNVAVAKEQQRAGIGRRLMSFLMAKAAERKMRDLFLEVRVGNAAAIALYESFGFKTAAVRKQYYRDGEDALVMHCALKRETPDAAEQTNLEQER